MKLIYRLLLSASIIICFNLFTATSALAQHKPFTLQSLKSIESLYSGKPFLLVLWSTDCPPCRVELALLGELKHDFKNFNLVIVATDGFEHSAQLDKILAEYSLEKTSNWAFKQANSPALKMNIDPDWYGEMPRSYFYNSKHQRIGLSGQLSREGILAWLNQT